MTKEVEVVIPEKKQIDMERVPVTYLILLMLRCAAKRMAIGVVRVINGDVLGLGVR